MAILLSVMSFKVENWSSRTGSMSFDKKAEFVKYIGKLKEVSFTNITYQLVSLIFFITLM